MLYRHLWGKPSVVVVQVAGRPVYTAQQSCGRCGTARNAISRALIRLTKGSMCLGAQYSDDREYRAELRRIEEQLAGMEADGLDVDREYAGTRGPKREAPPDLWHQYRE